MARSNLSQQIPKESLAKWVIELIEFEIKFRPQSSIKAQALVDFIVECTITEDPTGSKVAKGVGIPDRDMLYVQSEFWTMNMDGSSTPAGSGAGLLLSG